MVQCLYRCGIGPRNTGGISQVLATTSAEYASAASTCSLASSYSFITSSLVIPCANAPTTVGTGIWVPVITGVSSLIVISTLIWGAISIINLTSWVFMV